LVLILVKDLSLIARDLNIAKKKLKNAADKGVDIEEEIER